MDFGVMKEVIHTTVNFEDRPGIGHSVVFVDELYDEQDRLVGTTEGCAAVYSDPVDKRLRQLVSAVDRFEDGTVHWSGSYDQEPADEEHSVEAVGSGGRYLGLVGRRTWRMVERPDGNTTICVSGLVLEPAGERPAGLA